MFLKNRNISSRIKRSKVTDYAALTNVSHCIRQKVLLMGVKLKLTFFFYYYFYFIHIFDEGRNDPKAIIAPPLTRHPNGAALAGR